MGATARTDRVPEFARRTAARQSRNAPGGGTFYSGDVAHAGTRRHHEAQPVAQAIEHLEPGKAHHDHIVGLHIAQREREEILAFGLHERRAPSRGLLLPKNLPCRFLLFDPRPDDAPVDMQLAAIHRRARGQGKRVRAIQRPAGVLMIDLIEFDAGDRARDFKPAFHALQRKRDAGALEPGNQAKFGGGGGRWVSSHG